MIQIRKYDLNPITEIGQVAGICWGSDITNETNNYKRGLECIENNHGRVMEFTDIQLIIDDYSARVIRELYTHIIGTSRLQSSTRYIDYSDFKYFTPKSIEINGEAKEVYDNLMQNVKDTYSALLGLGIKKEDIGGILPLNSTSKIVLKINLRALLHLFNLRTCNRAYIEFRELMIELRGELMNLSPEWKLLCENYFKPKCKDMLYCNERYSCGIAPTKEYVRELIEKDKIKSTASSSCLC